MNEQTTIKVDTTHPAYEPLQMKRDDFAAVNGGTDAIRATGEKHLPKYPAEPSGDYKARLKAATIDGLVRTGVETLVGKVFDDEIDTTGIASQIVPFLENIDKEGTGFNIFARNAFEASFDGFSVILVDLPPMTEERIALSASRGAEADKLTDNRPYWRLYRAASVINWHYATNPLTHLRELKLLVLKEESDEVADDGFEHATICRYRVYRLMNGVVTWELYRETTDAITKKKTFILDGSGIISNVTQIPAAFIGCVTDDPKLLAESRLEIRAYQKESSIDTIEYLAIPVFYTIGYPEDAPALALGASTHLRLNGDGAAVGYAQIDASGLDTLKGSVSQIKDAIKQRLSQTADTQTRVIDKTATETITENRDKQSRLIVWSDELHDGLERALQFTGQMLGLGEDGAGTIELKTAWDREDVSAEAMPAPMAKAVTAGPSEE